MNNNKKDSVHYIINEAARKVICIIDNTGSNFIDFVENNLYMRPWEINERQFDLSIYNKFVMPRKFVGIATCSVDDNFSVETGKLIAFSRAKDKLNRSFFKRAGIYMAMLDSSLDKIADKINRYGANLEHNMHNRHEKIEELLNQNT